MPKVVIADVSQRTLTESIEQIFAAFGGVEKVIPRAGTVFIKPNGIHFSPHTHTDPRVLEALLAFLRDHRYTRLAVMENCTNGNFTRLVFRLTGYAELCRRYGAEAVYLDEGPTVEVTLRGEEAPTRIPRRLYDDLIAHKDDNFYLSLPKLKTHSMTTVTLGVKNQQAFPIHADRMARHTHQTLHRRLAAIYDLIRPDFCLIEGLSATIHGHFPVTALLEECVVPMNLLIGGNDTLAVDVVGARILGYSLAEVEHLRLAAEWGLGEGDLANIEVMGVPLARFAQKYPHTLLRRFHPDVRIIEGQELACVEGCKGNSECILEMLTNDYHGRGGWALIFGRGIDKSELEELPGDILVVGPCAVGEVAEWLRARYPDRKVYTVNEHNDLMLNTTYQARLMGVTPVMMVPMNPLLSALTLAQARLHGLTARVPPLLG
ncbi:MAG: DUF362 domain-containing protein [Anaerolineae bacterium]|jgi:uncharacterized protein (DUF362 family)|nr:DUF362 domain-containing protein [Anaerolineae bacterium]MDH7475527.1 DUF362 domain-containing protein [Anaerolineae bacterium]